jgi:hypothetical protein
MKDKYVVMKYRTSHSWGFSEWQRKIVHIYEGETIKEKFKSVGDQMADNWSWSDKFHYVEWKQERNKKIIAEVINERKEYLKQELKDLEG